MSSSSRSIAIIGGGLVGLATALKLQRRFPGQQVRVFEKESHVGQHQSGHNSGVLHCGLYYKPGSLKARMAVKGIQAMIEFCRQHDIRHEICGKVVVATRPDELPRLEELHRRGLANGLEGVRRLSADELNEIEPYAAGLAALHVPQEGIVDYRAVSSTMARLIVEAGGQVLTDCKVNSLRRNPQSWVLSTSTGDYEASFLVNCAGLYCDRVCREAGEEPSVKIIPFRGEYFQIRADRVHLVRHLIYPVPDPAFPFLGVHFTRLINGGVECGPNAVLAFSREGYSLGRINLYDLAESLAFPGLRAFLRKYPALSLAEFAQSLSRRRFCRALQRLVPEIRVSDLRPGGAGVRAQAMTAQGDLVQDFSLLPANNALHVLNAPSPGATASLAIGEFIAGQLPE